MQSRRSSEAGERTPLKPSEAAANRSLPSSTISQRLAKTLPRKKSDRKSGGLFDRFLCLSSKPKADAPSSTTKISRASHFGMDEAGGSSKRAAERSSFEISDSEGSPVRAPRRQVVLDSDTDGESPAHPDPPAAKRQRSGDNAIEEGEEGEEVVVIDDDEDDETGPAAPVVILSSQEDSPEKERPKTLVEKCEEIASKLKGDLGSGTLHNDRWCGAEQGSQRQLVTRAQIEAACGDLTKGLKDYQLVGINFMMLLKRSDVPGMILADEMGLGKTAQTICFLGLLSSLEGDPGPHLVVAPASLLENWERELHRWCPGLKTALYYGNDRAQTRKDLLWQRDNAGQSSDDSDVEVVESSDAEEEEGGRGGSSGSKGGLPFNVMLTGYSLFERDSEAQKLDREFLRKWDWSHIVLDEAHALKNRSASRTNRLRRISKQCKRRIMLTGTPLQNDLGELHGLLEFLLPELFEGANEDELEELEGDELAVERMKAILAPFIMRRLKSEVAKQLTQKQQRLEYVDMENGQAELYKGTVDSWCAMALEKKAKAGDSASAVAKRVGSKQVKNIFVELRKISQHPLLVRRLFSDADIEGIAKKAHSRGVFGSECSLARIEEELRTYSDFDLHLLASENSSILGSYRLEPEKLVTSAKFAALKKILLELKAAGSRPLIFSQWTSCLDLLGCLLESMGLRHLRLDGNTQVKERLELCDEFNDPDRGVFAFMLSTRAGGQGLNLTGADTVIIHDVDFNPQIDRQAEDRSHRLGQTKPVTVIRLVTRGTVDEDILSIAERKLKLDAAVLSGCTSEVGSDGLATLDEGSVQAELMRRLLERGSSG